jgi:hypothetical protein
MGHRLALAGAVLAGAGLLVLAMNAQNISERARKLHFSSIVVDTHDDTTQRLLDPGFDLRATRTAASTFHA